jgi:hypothetical protein
MGGGVRPRPYLFPRLFSDWKMWVITDEKSVSRISMDAATSGAGKEGKIE